MIFVQHYDSPLGGILLEDPDEENTAADLQLAEAAQQTAQNGTYGTAMLYYAFDDTVNSSRYPNYAYMQSYWTSVGLDTKLDTTVTVADLRRMNNYDLCVDTGKLGVEGTAELIARFVELEAHGHRACAAADREIYLLERSALRHGPAEPPHHQGERGLCRHGGVLPGGLSQRCAEGHDHSVGDL